ncbi:hypothetical protein SD961_16980 [Erwinia sp. MMLR14_017]|uniref:barstar family protein n=1 Tax=Erwinia sp. MMLR14_017 TaxID=3093842 RepID=UPI002990635B|nr:hypothetical protein [Erwinia sp. MMLR14_017]MDW8847559.1 hypothetical protein [Erwinia sp. MMLR14_017]
MRTESFDFDEIVDQAHFFHQFCQRFALADLTVTDLDGLWEVVKASVIPLPLEINFIHLGKGQKRRYEALILLFEEAEEELEGQLRFSIR